MPIVDESQHLVGILTNRDLRFENDLNRPVSEVMTSEGLVTAVQGTTLEEAQEILGRHRIEKLPVVDAEGRLTGLITVKDISKKREVPATPRKDSQGRLRSRRCGGCRRRRTASGPQALVDAGVDLLVVDTAHGHSAGVIEVVRKIKANLSVALVAGNIATGDSAPALIDAGADARQGRVSARAPSAPPAIVAGVRRAAAAPRSTSAPRSPREHGVARHRRRRHPVLRRHREGDRRRGGRRHGGHACSPGWTRRPARSCCPGRALQGLPGHGLARGDERPVVLEGPLLPGRGRGPPRSSCPRASKAVSPTRARSQKILYQLVGGLRSGDGLLRAPPSASCSRTRVRAHQPGRPAREPTRTTSPITAEAPNYWM